MKSVCIIGAGPAGLASAKALLQNGNFDVTVYEKNSKIGGIWELNQISTGGFLSPYTPTNLSRFTVGFSDLDWNSISCRAGQNGLQNGHAVAGGRPPMFPKAWMVNEYLKAYCDRYIQSDLINCEREVLEVHRIEDRWKVKTKSANSYEEVREFDYVAIATGFFAQPRLLSQSMPNLGRQTTELPIKVIHSSQFRNLEDLCQNGKSISGKKILMIGGGNSSGETAAAVALQLSDAQWSPASQRNNLCKDCKIIHVTPRPIYALPHFNEYEEDSRSYVPLDFKLYDFSKRPKELGAYAGRQTKEVKDIVHRAIQTMGGGDQSDLSAALVSKKGEGRGTAYVALSESYAEHVRSGLIDVVSGRVTGLQESEDDCVNASVQHGDEAIKIDDIAAVIYSTGYTPIPALDMLDDATKAAIKYDPTSLRLPAILEEWQTMTREVPSISFIGFYEGPYWPVIEMQAKLTAERWSAGKVTEQHVYENADELLRLRKDMRDHSLDIPQYWFNDYLGYMESMANELGLQRNDQGFGDREGCTSPARYVSKDTDHAQADLIMQELRQVWHDCIVNGRYVPRAAFRALHGRWNISRTIESAKLSFPSGTLEGTASFHPRIPTPDKTGRLFVLEYLYIESGTFHMSNGHSATASRRYIYRYSEEDDILSVWFVKPSNDREADYLFHNLGFVKPERARQAGALIAEADHLCVKDMYWTEYRLPMQGVALKEFEVKHVVKGPDKDYIAHTRYWRPVK